MSSAEHQPTNQEIDLKELINTIWQGRWKIAIIVFITTLLGIIFAFTQAEVFQADALLAPVKEEDSSALGGLTGQLGGLAGLAGIDLGKSGIDKKIIGIETLQSRVFLQNFIQKYNLLIPLLASEGWDEESQNWIFDEDKYDVKQKKWIDHENKLSLLIAYDIFEKMINVKEDAKTGIIRIQVDSYSPVHAKEWTENLINELNDYLRKQDVVEAKRSIQFLEEQLSKNRISEMQTVLYQMIEQQTKTMMLAEVRNGYVFRVVDPPVIPEERIKPKRIRILVLSILLGFILGVFFIIFSNKFIESNQSSKVKI